MYKGIILLLLAEVFFALSTVFAKFITNDSQIPGVEITFFRFFAGFISVSVYCFMAKKNIIPQNKTFIFLRALGNMVAVILFFIGLQYTTVTKSNMLCMTYPLFVFMVSPFINKEKIIPGVYYLFLLIAMVGMYLVIFPNFKQVNNGDLLSLFSGVIAGFSVSFLREAKKYDQTYTILFYTFGLGLLVNSFIVIPFFIIPKGIIIFYLVCASFSAVIGQFCITHGYKYIDAHAGSMVSNSRIFLAGLFGVIIFSETITLHLIAGAIFILIALLDFNFFGNFLSRREPR